LLESPVPEGDYNLAQRIQLAGGQRISMSMRTVLFPLFLLLAASSSFGQSGESDSQALREILAELRAIHEDMRVSETTQILIAELEMQQSAVSRATENADSVRAKLNDVRREQKLVTTELETAQENLDKATSADERNALSTEIERHKSNIAALKTVERDETVTLQEMEQRLQTAQDKLESIQDQLNTAISRLGPVSKDAGQK
jgi:chromosome segregation ATPase